MLMADDTVGPSRWPEFAEPLQFMDLLLNVRSDRIPTEQLRSEYQRHLDSFLKAFAPIQGRFEENVRGLLERSGFNDLHPAIDQGILSIDDIYGADMSDFALDGADPLLTGFAAKIQEVLTSGNVYPLFDARTSNFVRTGVEAGIFTPVPLARRLGSDAAMAAGLFDRLPNFPYATTSEILDIRRALARPLTQFRTGVRGLTEAIQVPPESPDFANAIEDAWNLTVAPALDEIEEAIRNNSSLGDLMSRSVKDALTSGTALGSALSLAGSMYVGAGPTVTIPLAAAVAVGFSLNQARAFMAQSADLKKTTEAQFYFLHGANTRLQATR
jgi:hypothetical protein